MLYQNAVRRLRGVPRPPKPASRASTVSFRSPAALRVGLLAALAWAPVSTAFAAMCDTPSADCELLSDRTYTAPNTYDYTFWNAIDVGAVGSTPTVTLTQNGGTVIGKALSLENNGYYNMNGGTANISGDYIVTVYSSGAVTSAATQTGGTVNVGGNLRFSLYSGNTGTYTLNGGNLNVGGRAMLVGDGTTSANAGLYLNGGVLTTNEVARQGNGFSGGNQDIQTRGELRFNGGTLRANTADNPNWINFSNGFSYLNNVTILAIDNGGAIFDTNGHNMGIGNNLGGAGGVTKRGAGTLTLSGVNSYGGGTAIEAGTLEVSASGNLGATNNSFGLYGGTLRVTGTGFTGLDSRDVNSAYFTGAIDIVDAGNTFTVPQWVGNGNLTAFTKLGAGTLVLSGLDSWRGGTIVNAGTLRLAGATNGTGTIRGALVINNATVDLVTTDALGYGEGVKVDSIAINAGTLVNSAPGANGNNGWGIAYTLNGSTMRSNGGTADPAAPSKFAFGGPAGANTQVNATGTAASTISGHIDLRGDNGNSNVNFTVDNGATLNIPASFSSHLGPADAAVGFTKLGGGLMSLQATNTHSGDTVLSLGTLAIADANALAASTLVLNAGMLSFPTITNATFGGLSGAQGLALQTPGNAAVALSVGANNADTTYSGVLTGGGSLTKIGMGTLTLTGNNNYSGATTVNAGTLRVNNVSGTGAVTVASGGTLAGNGRAAGASTVQSGGDLAPGNSVGTLTFSNGLTLNSGALLDLDLGTSSDLVRVSGGTFSATSGVVLTLSDSGGFGAGSYTLIDFTGAAPIGVAAANFTIANSLPLYHYTLSVQGTKLMLSVALAPPMVTAVSVPADGVYNVGRLLDFNVQFDKAMTVTGTPRLPVVLNSGTVYANYVSGSGTANLLFRATVVAGNSDNDGIAIATAVDANGGTLRDANGTDADPTLHNVPSTTGVTVDGIAPTATSIHLIGSPPPTSTNISYTVTFSEAVSGVDATDFKVETIDGSAAGRLGTVSGSGSSYTVAVNGVGGVGHLFLTLNGSGTGIADLAGNAISGGFRSGDAFEANLQRRCYVDKLATGANNATSWADAYNDLQSAVQDTGCIEIWTAKGVYKPGVAKTDSFRPRAGVKLYGGFAGSETDLAQRSADVIAANPTVLSGDIDNNDITDAAGVVLDAAQITGTNSVNVILMNNAPAAGYEADTAIDGFIVTAGDAGSGANGGGLRCDASLAMLNCNFTLNNLVFSGNRGGGGGALSLSSSAGTANAVVSKALFRGNRAIGAGASGGAVFLSASTASGRVSPAFSNVVFSGNNSLNWSGAIDLNVNQGTVTPTFDNATFSANTSNAQRGGAVASQAFGGGTASATLRNTILWDGSDPEIVLDGSGAAMLDHVIVQGGCPNGTTCTNPIAGDPQLGALGNHGGAVASLPLGTGSVAIDSGTCVLANDIRGIARPQGAGCDVGAVEARLHTLRITVVGGGSVSAGASPLPVSGTIANCVDACTATYDGETQPTVTLTATPNAQQTFSAWSGDCSGSDPAIALAMTAPKNCTATFVQNTTQTMLTLSSGANPSVYGTPLTFTATVIATPPALAAPTGSVSFHDGAALLDTIALADDGTATLATSAFNAGAHSITAQYNGDVNYAAASQAPSAALDQSVTPATPSVVWNAPDTIVYGTALSAAQLNATANWNGTPVAGSFVYAPLAGTVLGAGAGQTLTVSFTPGDTTNYTTATANVSIDVQRADQATLTVAATPSAIAYGASSALSITGGSGTGATSYQMAGSNCILNGNALTGTSVGSCSVTALKDADANYNAVASQAVTVTIVPATLTITPGANQSKVYGANDPVFTYSVSGLVGSDAVGGSLARAAGENAGSYAYVIGTVAANDPSNYAVTLMPDSFTIRRAPTTMTLSSACMLTFVESQPFTFDAAVSGVNGTSGNVTFANGSGSTLCSNVALSGGVAACTSNALSANGGTTTIYHLGASYGGDGNHQASSTSAPLTVTVLSAADVIFRSGFEADSLFCPIE